MPTIAIVDGVRLIMYWNDHAPPHFHALFAEHRAVVEIETLTQIEGYLPKPKLRGAEMGGVAPGRASGCMAQYASQIAVKDDQMKKLPRIITAEPVIHGVLKLVFTDGYEGVVDLRPIIAQGRIFKWLQKPKNFLKVQLEEYGHHVYWIDDKGYEIDLGADSLRRDAEKQAELHKLIAI